MQNAYTYFPDLAAEATIPDRGILSMTLSEADGIEMILFAMAPGERLSEHTSARPAIVHVVRGRGRLTVDGDEHPLTAGSWLRMAAHVRHEIVASEGLEFALYLLGA